jgi:hypothetical protein
MDKFVTTSTRPKRKVNEASSDAASPPPRRKIARGVGPVSEEGLAEKDLDNVESFEELLTIAKALQAELKCKSNAVVQPQVVVQGTGSVSLPDAASSERDAASLRKAISKAFKSQMQYSKSLKGGRSKRLTFTTPCTPTAAAILFGGALPSNGILSQLKMSQISLYGEFIIKSIRYGSLSISDSVNVKYSTNTGELTASSSYTM